MLPGCCRLAECNNHPVYTCDWLAGDFRLGQCAHKWLISSSTDTAGDPLSEPAFHEGHRQWWFTSMSGTIVYWQVTHLAEQVRYPAAAAWLIHLRTSQSLRVIDNLRSASYECSRSAVCDMRVTFMHRWKVRCCPCKLQEKLVIDEHGMSCESHQYSLYMQC